MTRPLSTLRLVILAALASCALIVPSAQALVVNIGSVHLGVALPAGLDRSGLPAVTTQGSCTDPSLPADLQPLPQIALCSHGGSVVHRNESFALYWDPSRTFFEDTRNFVNKFLRDVADASGTPAGPYALTPQYSDAGGRALNASIFGGPFTDFGAGWVNNHGNPGHNLPAGGCAATGSSFAVGTNYACVTDAQIRSEILNLIADNALPTSPQSAPGGSYTPVFMLFTPPGVTACLDATSLLCSANSLVPAVASGATSGSGAPAPVVPTFCSYHGTITIGGTALPYVVQPWTAGTACDDPSVDPIQSNDPLLATKIGQRLVSPLSQATLGAITNPMLDGWSALDGSEIGDNTGCAPDKTRDRISIGSGTYSLKPEANNAGLLVNDPNSPSCALSGGLSPRFTVPSVVNAGDRVQLDGSTSAATLVVPHDGYAWDFGDGTTATGPSVVHTFAKPGDYNVTLKLVDLGGNAAALTQVVSVAGPGGLVGPGAGGLHAAIQLVPQSFKSILRGGLRVLLQSNRPAAGFAVLTVSRATAHRARIRIPHGAKTVAVGRGTIAAVNAGVTSLDLRFSGRAVRKLKRLHHAPVSLRITLVSATGERQAIDAAGTY